MEVITYEQLTHVKRIRDRVKAMMPYIVKLIEEKIILTTDDMLRYFRLPISNVYVYMREIAGMYPDNLTYRWGIIILDKPFSDTQKKEIENDARKIIRDTSLTKGG